MMTEVSFTVDPEGLDGLRGRLAGIESRMQGIGGIVGSYSWQDLGPDTGVYAALEGFQSDWSNELRTITNNIHALAVLLGGAATDYRGTDNGIAQAAVPQDGPN
jgi:hypothetical protein